MANSFQYSGKFIDAKINKNTLFKILENIDNWFYSRISTPSQLSINCNTYHDLIISKYDNAFDFMNNYNDNNKFYIYYSIFVTNEELIIDYSNDTLNIDIKIKFDENWLKDLVKLIESSIIKIEKDLLIENSTNTKPRELKYNNTIFDVHKIREVFLQNTSYKFVVEGYKISSNEHIEEFVDVEKFIEIYNKGYKSYEVSIATDINSLYIQGNNYYTKIFINDIDENYNKLKLVIDELAERSKTTMDVKIFISHGHDEDWKILKDDLQDTHGIECDYFEKGSSASKYTFEILEEKLNSNNLALIVFSAEDKHESDTAFHARENVIHEAGLFQGKYGRMNVILLVEKGLKEFSNILGITQIRYEKGNILAAVTKVIAAINKVKDNM